MGTVVRAPLGALTSATTCRRSPACRVESRTSARSVIASPGAPWSVDAVSVSGSGTPLTSQRTICRQNVSCAMSFTATLACICQSHESCTGNAPPCRVRSAGRRAPRAGRPEPSRTGEEHRGAGLGAAHHVHRRERRERAPPLGARRLGGGELQRRVRGARGGEPHGQLGERGRRRAAAAALEHHRRHLVERGAAVAALGERAPPPSMSSEPPRSLTKSASRRSCAGVNALASTLPRITAR
jgi:hypothetical protein